MILFQYVVVSRKVSQDQPLLQCRAMFGIDPIIPVLDDILAFFPFRWVLVLSKIGVINGLVEVWHDLIFFVWE